MNEADNFALVLKQPGALEKAEPGAKRILSDMVADTLDLARKTASREVRVADTQLENWFQTGERYYFGESVAKDTAEAAKWYRQAAEQNHVRAQDALGDCYYKGEGVEKDEMEAVKWYRRAAEQNHVPAQHNLGVCYDNGQGVTHDDAEAVKWYRRAAEQNFAIAQHNLGVCYENGNGVQQDFPEAYKFYKLAAEQNKEKAVRNLQRIVTRMTAVEIADGERRFREFYAQKIRSLKIK
jgi:TPR repeat protein